MYKVDNYDMETLRREIECFRRIEDAGKIITIADYITALQDIEHALSIFAQKTDPKVLLTEGEEIGK